MTDEQGTSERYCSNCGESIDPKAEICPECGVRQQVAGSTQKDRTVAAILAIFLGGLGAHKIYLGKVGQALLYFCFSWTLIPSIIAFVEGIIYLTQSDEEFQSKHAA